MAYTPIVRRCWRYLHGCRNNATNSVRIGARAITHCDEHTPATKEQR